MDNFVDGSVMVVMKGDEYDSKISDIVERVAKKSVCYVCMRRGCADVIRDIKNAGGDADGFVFIDTNDNAESDGSHIYLGSSATPETLRDAVARVVDEVHPEILVFDTLDMLLGHGEKFHVMKFANSIMCSEGIVKKMFLIVGNNGGMCGLVDDMKMIVEKSIETSNI